MNRSDREIWETRKVQKVKYVKNGMEHAPGYINKYKKSDECADKKRDNGNYNAGKRTELCHKQSKSLCKGNYKYVINMENYERVHLELEGVGKDIIFWARHWLALVSEDFFDYCLLNRHFGETFSEFLNFCYEKSDYANFECKNSRLIGNN